MPALLSLLMICFAVHFTTAQTLQNDSILGAQLLKKADSLAEKNNYTAATKTALQAAAIFQKVNDWNQWYEAYKAIFYNGYDSRDHETSIDLIQKGIEKLPETEILAHGKTYYLLGILTIATGNIPDALLHYEQSIAYLEKANDIEWLGIVIGNISQVYTREGDYSKAQDYLKIAITHSESAKDSLAIWKNTKALGSAYFYAGDLNNAKKTYTKAQQLKDLKDGTFELYEAEIQFELENYELALKSVNKALKSANTCETDTNEQPYLYRCKEVFANASIFLGEIYLKLGQAEKALRQFQKSIPYIEASNNKRAIGKLHIQIGDAQKMLKQYDNALRTYQKTLHTFIPDFTDTNPHKNPAKNLWTLEIWLMEIFKNKGDCFYAKYEESNNEKWLYLAEENYELAANFTENVRLNFTETDSKLTLGFYTNSFYEELIKTKLTLFELTKEKQYQAQAFLIAQRANAFVLRGLLNEKQALKAAGIPKNIIALFEKYVKEINTLKKKIQDSLAPDSLQNSLITAKETFQNLKKEISKKNPKFDVLRNDLKGVTVEELQTKIASNTLFIKYFLGKETLYIFSISQEDFQLNAVSLPKDFQNLVFDYRQSVSNISFINTSPDIAEKQYLQTAHSLYNILLSKPLLHHDANAVITELTIIPDGILNTIPFQVLLRKKSDSWTNIDNTVIKDYAIGHHYFCKMVLNATEKQNVKDNFISFGLELDQQTLSDAQTDTENSINNTLASNSLRSNIGSKLTFSDDEALKLAKLMNGKSWINEKATKSNFIKNATNATGIHLATHALLNTKNPNVSALVFTKTNDTLSNLLRLDEIYNHNFNSNMITLSACNTGFGKHQKGEGLQSLARAFNFSKIPSVTATLWSIPDASSAKIMELYYSYLKEGHSKSIALQKAQLEYVENDDISSPASRLPFYWSAWTHIGTNDAIEFKQQNNHAYLLFFFLSHIIFIDWIFWFRNYTKAS
ncbi:CHAT domain-containing protein [Kordia sp. YSTF-M3]|uniref:CHAT domain-containing protein n=1 Tax=Kordia aestuariivivens TaxID=2759037 RepID=A0ABR7QGH1_9FLAO|nr:CHAT domain-containing protein [Kordia aestuariivivens]MBC8757461.1 CHAT domain-containing protein [Kordia aestuariivivens]